MSVQAMPPEPLALDARLRGYDVTPAKAGISCR
jgi:hypothetical protein